MKTLRASSGPTLLLAAILVFTTTRSNAATASDASTTASIPADWIKVDTGPFSFMAPPDLRNAPAQGIDSMVGRYQCAGISISFDYGRYSDPLTEYMTRRPLGENVVIDGKEARLVKSEKGVQIHFPVADRQEFGPGQEMIDKLTFSAMYEGAADEKKAEAIVRSIQFVAQTKRENPQPTPEDGWKQIVAGDIATFAAPPELAPDDSAPDPAVAQRYGAPGLKISAGVMEFDDPPAEILGANPAVSASRGSEPPVKTATGRDAILVYFPTPDSPRYKGPAVKIEFVDYGSQKTALRIARTIAQPLKDVTYKPAKNMPDGWTEISIRDRFSFSAPPGKTLFPREERPKSVEGNHTANPITFRFDYGDSDYWKTQLPKPGEPVENAVIGGRKAILKKDERNLTVYFLDLKKDASGAPVNLYVFISYPEVDAKRADMIARSIHFPDGPADPTTK